jgi:hypothetical protein
MEGRLWAWHTRTETRDVPVEPTARGYKSRCAHILTGHERFDQVIAELPACIAAV